jgi:hypothetical protein
MGSKAHTGFEPACKSASFPAEVCTRVCTVRAWTCLSGTEVQPLRSIEDRLHTASCRSAACRSPDLPSLVVEFSTTTTRCCSKSFLRVDITPMSLRIGSFAMGRPRRARGRSLSTTPFTWEPLDRPALGEESTASALARVRQGQPDRRTAPLQRAPSCRRHTQPTAIKPHRLHNDSDRPTSGL